MDKLKFPIEESELDLQHSNAYQKNSQLLSSLLSVCTAFISQKKKKKLIFIHRYVWQKLHQQWKWNLGLLVSMLNMKK